MKKQIIVVLCCTGCYMMGLLDNLDKMFTPWLVACAMFSWVAYQVSKEGT